MARLVLNHSTFIAGLLPILKRLSTSNVINTIVPGRISHTTSNNLKGSLELRLTTSTFSSANKISSQKILARAESTCQEVFLSFNDTAQKETAHEIQQHIVEVLGKKDCTVVTTQKEKQVPNEKPQKPKQ